MAGSTVSILPFLIHLICFFLLCVDSILWKGSADDRSRNPIPIFSAYADCAQVQAYDDGDGDGDVGGGPPPSPRLLHRRRPLPGA